MPKKELEGKQVTYLCTENNCFWTKNIENERAIPGYIERDNLVT